MAADDALRDRRLAPGGSVSFRPVVVADWPVPIVDNVARRGARQNWRST
jgi:hypothetical protein